MRKRGIYIEREKVEREREYVCQRVNAPTVASQHSRCEDTGPAVAIGAQAGRDTGRCERERGIDVENEEVESELED